MHTECSYPQQMFDKRPVSHTTPQYNDVMCAWVTLALSWWLWVMGQSQ